MVLEQSHRFGLIGKQAFLDYSALRDGMDISFLVAFYPYAGRWRFGGSQLESYRRHSAPLEQASAARNQEEVRARQLEAASAERSRIAEEKARRDRQNPTDAGYVADLFVAEQMRAGTVMNAELVGYQQGLGLPVVAIYRGTFLTKAGLHRTGYITVGLYKEADHTWSVQYFEAEPPSGLVPMRRTWQEVVQMTSMR